MLFTYGNSALQYDFAPLSSSSLTEDTDYAARLREVENVLLCQALGGQLPLPGSQQRLQRYLDGKIDRAEAFDGSAILSVA